MTGSVGRQLRRSIITGASTTEVLVRRYAEVSADYGTYPPQQQLTTSFTVEDYRQHALASNELPLPAPLAIVTRIPDCSQLQRDGPVVSGDEPLNNYVKYLHRELALQSLLFDSDRVVTELHIEADSGTRPGVTEIEAIMTHVERHFTVSQDASREVSVFAGAIFGGLNAISPLAELGVNRLRLGRVADDAVSSLPSTNTTFESAAVFIETARLADIRSIAAELWYGYAGQTLREFEQAITRLARLKPDRISIHDYGQSGAAAHTASAGADSGSPDANVRFDMMLAAHDGLGANGYRHLGNGHFALAGDDLAAAQKIATLSYTARGYSSHGRCDWIGLGAGAIGNVHNGFAANAPDVDIYIRCLKDNGLPISAGYALTADDRIRHSIIQAILCKNKLAFDDIERCFGIEFDRYFADELTALEALARDGLIETCAGELILTLVGALMRSRVAGVFDRSGACSQH